MKFNWPDKKSNLENGIIRYFDLLSCCYLTQKLDVAVFNDKNIPRSLDKWFQLCVYTPCTGTVHSSEWAGSLKYVIEFRLIVFIEPFPKYFRHFPFTRPKLDSKSIPGPWILSPVSLQAVYMSAYITVRDHLLQGGFQKCHGWWCWLLGVDVAGSLWLDRKHHVFSQYAGSFIRKVLTLHMQRLATLPKPTRTSRVQTKERERERERVNYSPALFTNRFVQTFFWREWFGRGVLLELFWCRTSGWSIHIASPGFPYGNVDTWSG